MYAENKKRMTKKICKFIIGADTEYKSDFFGGRDEYCI